MLHDLLTIPIVVGTAISLVSLAVIVIGVCLLVLNRRLRNNPFVRAAYAAEPELFYAVIASKPQKEVAFSSKVKRNVCNFLLWLHVKLDLDV